MVMEAIRVHYAGRPVGAASYDRETGLGGFEYAPAFLQSGIELSPLFMPLRPGVFRFPGLDADAFKGLPGMLADSLPDDFGNAVLNAWVARQGRAPDDISPLQRLQYTGTRGMGALAFLPATRLQHLNASERVAVDALVAVAQQVLDERQRFAATLDGRGQADQEAMRALLSVGTSAGGARPKAVLAFDRDLRQVRSGQTDAPDGFTHYLLKFDGVVEHRAGQETFGDPRGYGVLEWVYARMATACGIDMMPCRLLDEGPRRHFLTERFDRRGNRKIHVQTLNGLAHVSFRRVGQFSYEELFQVMRRLGLPMADAEQMFRRMVFNVVARNHDDHAKNIAFLLDPDAGHVWRLAPAYDLAYSYKPGSPWVSAHAMSLNGKRDNFVRDDFHAFERVSRRFTRRWIDTVIDEVKTAVAAWPVLARDAGVPDSLVALVAGHLRLSV